MRHLSPAKKSIRNTAGFTIIELMIVVSIIALITAIALPSWQSARLRSQRVTIVNELRVTHDALATYAAEHNGLPYAENGAQTVKLSRAQEVPPMLVSYMPKNTTWTGNAIVGGYWYWLSWPGHSWGYNGYVLLYAPTMAAEERRMIDKAIDDGLIDEGQVRVSGDFIFYGVL